MLKILTAADMQAQLMQRFGGNPVQSGECIIAFGKGKGEDA